MFTQAETKEILDYDPVQAAQLVKDAGYADGITIEFQYPGQAYGDEYQREIELLQAQQAKVGINLVFKILDPSLYYTNTREGNYQMQMRGKRVIIDWDSYLSGVHKCGSSANYSRTCDAELDKLLAAQQSEADPARRMAISRDAVRIINENAYDLALYYKSGSQFWHPYVKDFTPNWATSPTNFVRSWLDQ